MVLEVVVVDAWVVVGGFEGFDASKKIKAIAAAAMMPPDTSHAGRKRVPTCRCVVAALRRGWSRTVSSSRGVRAAPTPGMSTVRSSGETDDRISVSSLLDARQGEANTEVDRSVATWAPLKRCSGRKSSIPPKTSFHGTGRSFGTGTGPVIRLATISLGEP